MISLDFQYEGNLVIEGKGIMVGLFDVITVNTMIMANVSIMVSVLANTEMSVFMSVVSIYACCL
jgi:hypothetical protein